MYGARVGVQLVVKPWQGHKWQLWKWDGDHLRSMASNHYITIAGEEADGEEVFAWDWADTGNWEIEGKFIKNKFTGKVLFRTGWKDGSKVEMQTKQHGNKNMEWNIVPA
jgi:hypothetical protein